MNRPRIKRIFRFSLGTMVSGDGVVRVAGAEGKAGEAAEGGGGVGEGDGGNCATITRLTSPVNS